MARRPSTNPRRDSIFCASEATPPFSLLSRRHPCPRYPRYSAAPTNITRFDNAIPQNSIKQSLLSDYTKAANGSTFPARDFKGWSPPCVRRCWQSFQTDIQFSNDGQGLLHKKFVPVRSKNGKITTKLFCESRKTSVAALRIIGSVKCCFALCRTVRGSGEVAAGRKSVSPNSFERNTTSEHNMWIKCSIRAELKVNF